MSEIDLEAIRARAFNKRWPMNAELGHLRGDNLDLCNEVERLRAENAQLAASVLEPHGADCVYAQRLAAVEELHSPEAFWDDRAEQFCGTCQRTVGVYPCDTIKAVRGE